MALGSVDSLIGRMFGNQSMPQIYGKMSRSEALKEVSIISGTDSVELSENAPKPLDSEVFEKAVSLAEKVLRGEKLTSDETKALREDRVFAAVSVLVAAGVSGNEGAKSWPGGIPAPSEEELQAAYRRLTQRLAEPEGAELDEKLRNTRAQVLDSLRCADFSEIQKAYSANSMFYSSLNNN